MSDSLFDVYTNVESAKELWDSLESKYMAEDSSSKKFLASNFNNYKTVDSRPVMKQYNELLRILGQYTQHGLKMDESISVSSIIDKLPHSWKDFKHTLKHGKDNLSLVQLGSFTCSMRIYMDGKDSDKGKDKYLEGQSMQRPPLFESDHFIYWKNRFETYVKAKDLDLWHIILNGDFPPVARNKETQVLETVPFEQQDDDLKKKLAKNNKAKMVLYNALPKKEYERMFMCKTTKDIWQSLLITHQVHEVVMKKDSKIYRGKKERVKSIALKAKKESSDDETSTSRSDDEEYATAIRNFKKFFRRKGKFVRQPREEKKSFRQRDEKKGKSVRTIFRCSDPKSCHLRLSKLISQKDQKAFIRGS
ncbi:hypothetical protein Tco_1173266 [Tanacetum coccineum]